jgi:zinc protease
MFKKYQLKNGLNVLLVESHKSPVLSIQMWVKTGSADEKKGEEGISHFIEHLVFKGTRKFKVGEIASQVEAAGGELNAYTSFDQTVFYVTISKEFQNVGLDVISEMMGFPRFDDKEIDNEREVVIEEIKRSNDSPHRQASRLLFETMYKKHPYGIPVIGYAENISKVSRKVLVNYFNSRYNPKTMTLIVAGDFKSAEMKKKIAEQFGIFKQTKLRVVKRKKDVAAKKSALVVKTAPFAETIVHLAFPTPKASHKDIAALEVFALIFGQGESSRLNQRLRTHGHLVNFAGSSVFVARDPGFMAISVSLNEKDFDAAMAALLEEMQKILTEPVGQEELQKAVTNLSSEQFYNLETVDGLARKYGHYQDLFGDPTYFEKFMKQVQALTVEDIGKVARKYLDPKSASLVIMTPAEQKHMDPMAKDWMANFRKSAGKKTSALKTKPRGRAKKISWVTKRPKSLSLDIQKFELSNGATLIMRPSFDTPVLSLRCASLGGSRLETPDLQGSTELLSRVWTSGAGPYDEISLNRRIDEMAASISSFGGRNSQGLTMTCLRPFSDEMLELFALHLIEPHFEAKAVDREVKSMQEHVKLRQDNPAQLCILQFMRNMFGDHPYGRDLYGEPDHIAELTGEHVRKIFEQQMGLTLVASGAIEPGELKKSLEKYLKSFKVNTGSGLKLFPIQHPSNDIRAFLESKKQQSHIVFGFPGLKLKDPERYALQVMQAVLAGQGGRLFIELRDKASLAYSVSPMRMEGLEGGYFGAYIGCSPEKSATALKMMQIEFDKLVQVKIGDEEMDRAKRYLIGKHDIELQKNSNITSSILFDHIYGIDFLETYRFGEKIRQVTAEQVQELARSIFSKPSVTSLVGPAAPW